MCYFLYLRLVPQRKPDDAKAFAAAQEVAGRLSLSLYDHPPLCTLTDNGHCACNLVVKQKRLGASVLDFVQELVGQAVIKSVEIGYRWSAALSEETSVERLSIDEFASLNTAAALTEGIWYRVNDPSKYDFGRFPSALLAA